MSATPLLDSVATPADLRRLPAADLPKLAAEIRAELVEVVAANGGHLAPNLGVVELTLALLRVFDPDRDRIVWDTGHQGYVYKLLTGRRQLFRSLRQDDGCCGFLHREESPYDVFGAGHAGTAISAALGFAAARDRAGGRGKVVAVVGDGALGCGVSLEGLNSIIETTRDFVLVLNDNRMSISPNVGALARYLNRVISGSGYNRFKERLRDWVDRIPRVGPRLHRLIHRLEEVTKGLLVPGLWFEQLGLRYIGPLDGHDLRQLTDTLERVRNLAQPLVVHVVTRKGKGYEPAEMSPEDYHGLSPFDPTRGRSTATGPTPDTFADALGRTLCEAIRANPRVVAITAGMCHGTGLRVVREQYPRHLFDVGIAEEHAVVFAAGLAAAGHRPVLAVYATFSQRAMDYVYHDVCLQNLPVVLCLDRAGIVEDGPTHHGILDLAFWRALPNLAVLQPADAWELEQMLGLLLAREAPGVLRYPKGAATRLPVPHRAPLAWGRAELLREGADVSIWALGRESARALEVADDLARLGIEAAVVNPRFLLPLDADLLRAQAARQPIVTLEDHGTSGGLASLVAETLSGHPGVRLLARGWPQTVVPWGTVAGLRRRFGLDRERLVQDVAAFVRDTEAPHADRSAVTRETPKA